MKKPLRLVCGALAALFSAAMLAGCSGEDSSIASSGALSVAPTGGYVEEDVSPDHNYNVGLFVVDGILNVFTVENPVTPSPSKQFTGMP